MPLFIESAEMKCGIHSEKLNILGTLNRGALMQEIHCLKGC